MANCFLVMGTPRSGTNMLGAVLKKLGLNTGATYEEFKNDWLPVGMQHDVQMNALLTQMLQFKCGCANEHAMVTIENLEEVKDCPHTVGFIEEMILLNRREYNFGLVSNHLCKVIKPFLSLCENINIKMIKMARPIEVSIESFATRMGVTPEEVQPIIDFYKSQLDAAENEIKNFGGSVFVANYDEIVDNKEQKIAEIASFVGLPVTEEAINCVNENFRRFRA
jgi:hypothetical protein